MVKIRLTRMGTTKRPTYRIVAIDSRRKRQGRVLELLGTYDPLRGGALRVKDESVQRWLSQGAQVTSTVRTLLRRHAKQAAVEAREAQA